MLTFGDGNDEPACLGFTPGLDGLSRDTQYLSAFGGDLVKCLTGELQAGSRQVDIGAFADDVRNCYQILWIGAAEVPLRRAEPHLRCTPERVANRAHIPPRLSRVTESCRGLFSRRPLSLSRSPALFVSLSLSLPSLSLSPLFLFLFLSLSLSLSLYIYIYTCIGVYIKI